MQAAAHETHEHKTGQHHENHEGHEEHQHHAQGSVSVVERHTDTKTDAEYGVVVTSHTVVVPGWQGAMGMRVLALVVFAGSMAVVVGVLTRRIMRKYYGSESSEANTDGSGRKVSNEA